MIGLFREAFWLTRARVLRVGTIFLIASVALVAWDFARHTENGLTDGKGEHLARDFVSYWTTAQLALRSEPADVYDVAALSAAVRDRVGPVSEPIIYVYPPVARMLMAPLGALGFGPALALWLLVGTGLNLLLLRRATDSSMAFLAATASPAVLLNTLSGQTGQLVSALLGGGILLLDRRPLVAGILVGALCWKPQLGVLVPVAFAAAGRWRSFAAAAATSLALVAASLALFGVEPWHAFFDQAVRLRQEMETSPQIWHRLPTVFAAARVAGLSVAAAYGLQIFSAAAAAASVVIVWRRATDLPVRGASLLLATFLATPYAWDYDMVVLSLAVVWLAGEGMRNGFQPWERLILALVIILPLVISPLASALGVAIAPFVLWAALILTVHRTRLAATAGPRE